VNNELERLWKEAVWRNLKSYLGICLEEMKKTVKNLNQDRWSSGQDFNSGHSKYEATMFGLENNKKS
jgi:hypothetical protein